MKYKSLATVAGLFCYPIGRAVAQTETRLLIIETLPLPSEKPLFSLSQMSKTNGYG